MTTGTNPFTPGSGKRPLWQASDQQNQIVLNFLEALRIGPSDPRFTSMVLGTEGSGKTRFLAQVAAAAESLEKQVVTVPVIAAGAGTLKHISATAFSVLSPSRQWAKSFGGRLSDPPDNPDFFGLASEAAANDQVLLVTIDDMQNMDVDEARSLMLDVQRVTKSEQLPLALLATALPSVHRGLFDQTRLSFIHRIHTYDLPPLTVPEAKEAIRWTINSAGGSIAPKALKLLSEAVGGSPSRLQQLGYEAWETAGGLKPKIDETVAQRVLTSET